MFRFLKSLLTKYLKSRRAVLLESYSIILTPSKDDPQRGEWKKGDPVYNYWRNPNYPTEIRDK